MLTLNSPIVVKLKFPIQPFPRLLMAVLYNSKEIFVVVVVVALKSYMLCFIVVLSLCYCVSSWVKLLLLARITSPLIMNLWCDMNRQTLGTRYRSAYPYVTHTYTHTHIKLLCEHANKCVEALAKLEHWLALAWWNTQRLVNSFHWVFFTLSSWGWR